MKKKVEKNKGNVLKASIKEKEKILLKITKKREKSTVYCLFLLSPIYRRKIHLWGFTLCPRRVSFLIQIKIPNLDKTFYFLFLANFALALERGEKFHII